MVEGEDFVEITRAAEKPLSAPAGVRGLTPLVIGLFFLWGFSTVLLDSLVPKLKALFQLSYAEVMLSQFCFFLAYLFISIPASILLGRIGYMRGIVVGLGVMALGCAGFAPAAALGTYGGILIALFVMASGITMLQVAANPLVAALGLSRSASSRLTLAQAFNALGTSIGPWVGARLILGTSSGAAPDPATAAPALLAAYRRAEIGLVEVPFVAIAAVLLAMALVFWLLRDASGIPGAERLVYRRAGVARLLKRSRLVWGAVAIFLYVGAEVTIGSFMTNYLMLPSRLGVPAEKAGQLVALYWTGAMIGRFVGSPILRRYPPGAVLAIVASIAAALVAVSALSGGGVSAAAILAVGLFNAIMFPTIFTLALDGLGAETPQGSGILCTAIVGGAIIPWLAGVAADHVGVASALFVPICCYLVILGYGFSTREPWREGMAR